MKNKTVPLPCTQEQYKEIKMYCLLKGLKYSDLTEKLLKIINEELNSGKNM